MNNAYQNENAIETIIQKAWNERKPLIKGNTVKEFMPWMNCSFDTFHDRIPIFIGMLPRNNFDKLRASIQKKYHQNTKQLPDNQEANIEHVHIVEEGYCYHVGYATQPVTPFVIQFVPRAIEIKLLQQTIYAQETAGTELFYKVNKYLQTCHQTTLNKLREEIKAIVEPEYAHLPKFHLQGDVNGISLFYGSILTSMHEAEEISAQNFFNEYEHVSIHPYAQDKDNAVFKQLRKKLTI